MEAFAGDGDVIQEAFKPGTGPADIFSVIGMDEFATGDAILDVSPQAKPRCWIRYRRIVLERR